MDTYQRIITMKYEMEVALTFWSGMQLSPYSTRIAKVIIYKQGGLRMLQDYQLSFKYLSDLRLRSLR